MFPYRDEIQTQGTAYITASIIGLNVLAWIFIQGAGDILGVAWSVCNLGLIPGELTGRLPPGTQFSMGYGLVCSTEPGRQVSHILTSMFLHSSWAHLLGNMWFFWIFGKSVEERSRYLGCCSNGKSVEQPKRGRQLARDHVVWRNRRSNVSANLGTRRFDRKVPQGGGSGL